MSGQVRTAASTCSATVGGTFQLIGSPSHSRVTLIPASRHSSYWRPSSSIPSSRLNSPTQLDPQAAFRPMEALVADSATARSTICGQALISLSHVRLVLRWTKTSHRWTRVM